VADQQTTGNGFSLLSIATFCFIIAGIALGAYQWHAYSEAQPPTAIRRVRAEEPTLIEGDLGVIDENEGPVEGRD